jgi:hypothetical protein
MSPEHVPAPQLASPALPGFGAAAFLVSVGGDLLAGDAFALVVAAAAGPAVAVDAGAGAADGVVGEAAVVGGAAAFEGAAGGVSDFGLALPEQPFAEHEA